jgi:AAA domain
MTAGTLFDSPPPARRAPSGSELTDEQEAVLDHVRGGQRVTAVVAGPGTGKSATIRAISKILGDREIKVAAFNRPIIDDIKKDLPANARAQTFHGLAFGAVGKHFSHRIPDPKDPNRVRITDADVAAMLKIDPIVVGGDDGTAVHVEPRTLAGMVGDAMDNFAKSSDDEPGKQHFEWLEGVDSVGNEAIRTHLMSKLCRHWDDARDPNGTLPYRPDFYIAHWATGGLNNRPPRVFGDTLFVDEAQDLTRRMRSVFQRQKNLQIAYLGDPAQAINAWMGAVSIFEKLPDGAAQLSLTRSFRFGQAIADIANDALEALGMDMRLVGNPALDSTVGPTLTPTAVLCRTNAEAVRRCLLFADMGVRAHLLGNGGDVKIFAFAAKALQEGRRTSLAGLGGFATWDAVVEHAEQDSQGKEITLLVKLVCEFGPDRIIAGLEHMPTARQAQVIVSTAHKTKGLQFLDVQLGGDSVVLEGQSCDDDRRLYFVAATRAQQNLDLTHLASPKKKSRDKEI